MPRPGTGSGARRYHSILGKSGPPNQLLALLRPKTLSNPQKVKNWIKLLRRIGTPNSASLDILSTGQICTVTEEESDEADFKEETSHLLGTGLHETTVQSSPPLLVLIIIKTPWEIYLRS